MKLITTIALSILCINLQAQQFIKLTPTPDSHTLKKPISSIYKNKNQINVILRNSSYDFNSNRGNDNKYGISLLFNTIEKEFIKYGLNVKDASLFQMENTASNNDADLLVDLANVDDFKVYTNKYYTKKGVEKGSADLKDFFMVGLKFEFRFVDVRSNEIVGFYTMSFTPCTQGCEIKIHTAGRGRWEFVDKRYEKFKGKYEFKEDVTEDYIEFCKTVANSLIGILKKNTSVESLVNESNETYTKARKEVFKYFPESHFFGNYTQGEISKKKSIYIDYFNGVNISPTIAKIFKEYGYEITTNINEASYFLFYYKGKMLKSGFDPNCIQFQFIDAKTLRKLSGASYKKNREDYDEDLILTFIESL